VACNDVIFSGKKYEKLGEVGMDSAYRPRRGDAMAKALQHCLTGASPTSRKKDVGRLTCGK